MEKLTSFGDLGGFKEQLEKNKAEEKAPEEEIKPETQPEQPETGEKKETKRKRPFDALSRVQKEINRLGEELVKNKKLANEDAKKGRKGAAEYQKMAEYFQGEFEKAKAVRDKIKDELARKKKSADFGKKDKRKLEEKGGEENIYTEEEKTFMEEREDWWEKQADAELEKELNKIPQKHGEQPTAESVGEIESRKLNAGEIRVLANKLLEGEDLGNLSEEKREWLVKMLKKNLSLGLYEVTEKGSISQTTFDAMKKEEVEPLLETLRLAGFSIEENQISGEGQPEEAKPTIEEERTPEEILNERRTELAKAYAGLKEKTLGTFGSEQIENKEDAQRVALLENTYRESLKEYRKDLIEKYPNKPSAVVLKTVAEEANKLNDEKWKFQLQAKEGTAMDWTKKMLGRAVKRYEKIPKGYKYLLAGALFAGGLGAGHLAGAAGWYLATGVVTGRWFQRMLGGAAATVGLEAKIQSSQEKQEEKETLKEFKFETLSLKDEILSTLEKDGAKWDKKLFELEGGKKEKRIGRFALAGAAGGLLMSGYVGKAIGNMWGMLPDSVKSAAAKVTGSAWKWLSGTASDTMDSAKEGLGLQETPAPFGEATQESVKSTTGVEQVPTGIETHSAVIEKGGSVWSAAEELVKDPKEFSEAWKNSMVQVPGQEGVIPISEVNLVHPGTVVEYVPGEGGGTGHFEINTPEGQELPGAGAQEAFTDKIEVNKEMGEISTPPTTLEGASTPPTPETPVHINESLEQVFTGEESRAVALKTMFGEKLFADGAATVSERADGIAVVHNAFGEEGFDLLISPEGKIGIDGPSGWNWGSKGQFLGFGDRIPTENLTPETIQEAKNYISETVKDLNTDDLGDGIMETEGVSTETIVQPETVPAVEHSVETPAPASEQGVTMEAVSPEVNGQDIATDTQTETAPIAEEQVVEPETAAVETPEETPVATEPNNEASVEGLSEEATAQVEFLNAQVSETKNLLTDYQNKYGDRGNFEAFKTRVMELIDRTTEMSDGIANGDKTINFQSTGNMSPEEFAKTTVENEAAQTNLLTFAENQAAAFDELN